MGNPISVTSASALEIGGVTVVEVEGNYLVLPSPGQYVLTGNSGRRNIICSDNTGEQYEARLSNPSKCKVVHITTMSYQLCLPVQRSWLQGLIQ